MFTRNGALVIISKIKDTLLYFRSLKFYLFLLVVIVGIVPCLFLQFGILGNFEERSVSVLAMDVRTQTEIVANRISNSDYLDNPSSEAISAQLSQLSNIYGGRILVVNSRFEIVQDTYAMSIGKMMVSEEVIRGFHGEEDTHLDSQNGYLEITVPIRNEDASKVVGVMVISASTATISDSLDLLKQKTFVLQIVIVILIIVLALVLSIALVRPLEILTKKLRERFDGYGEEQIHVNTYRETREISEEINAMIDRMQVLDDSRQEFVSNVSHELKTPITSMKVLADSLLMMDNVPVEMYQEFMEDITEEIDRESKIIDDLLSMVKLDKTGAVLNIAQININELLELLMKRLGPIAQKRGIELVLVCERQVIADADEVKLTLALSNFIENAIKYNRDNGWVHVKLDADHKQFTVIVEDCGIGIPREDQAYIFERFYRVDKSHSREIGGTGLGLSIARSTVLLHKGAVEVESEPDVGTKFTIRIPLTYIPN